ncbi:MAG: molecular chaperone TorD family protein [Deltaproteobacteria bacterium]|nr:molecular chaperone TorD family protein [Deltaproteobacteria bacterium]
MLKEIAEDVDLSRTAQSRSNVYRLFSMCYINEVTSEFLKTLKSKNVMNSLSEFGVDFSKILFDAPEEKLLDILAGEYAALFIVPGGIPPYESVRLKGLLCQEPEWKVREFYKRCGLTVRDDCKIFSDHLGMELEFMGYLTDKEAKAWGDKDEKTAAEWLNLQKEFFANHLNKWVFGFLNDMDKCAFHPFYKEVARLTKTFLEVEKQDLTSQDASCKMQVSS